LDKLDEEKKNKKKSLNQFSKLQVVEGSIDHYKQFIISEAEKKDTNC
jgi:hypothetical protein